MLQESELSLGSGTDCEEPDESTTDWLTVAVELSTEKSFRSIMVRKVTAVKQVTGINP